MDPGDNNMPERRVGGKQTDRRPAHPPPDHLSCLIKIPLCVCVRETDTHTVCVCVCPEIKGGESEVSLILVPYSR